MGNHKLTYLRCECCDLGVISYHKEHVDVNYKNEIVLNVEQHYYKCSYCGNKFTTPDQKAINSRKVYDAYVKSQSLDGWVYGKAI